jgi:FAD-linked sulfhydryl oxidase
MPSPKIWGRYFWTTLHLTALGYPENPTHEDMNIYKTYMTFFGQVLPCKNCVRNYSQHMEKLDLVKALQSRDALFAWTVALHNAVNHDQHKAEWTVDYALEYYMNGTYNEHKVDDALILKNDIWRIILILMIMINVLLILYVLHVIL